MHRHFTTGFLLVLAFLLFTGCAQTESLEACVDPAETHGFFHGLLQGFIAPITVLLSIFMDNVAMYSANNSGWLYDLGFVLGIGGFSGGVFKSRRRRKRG